ncbi:MAG: DUF5698 domain-containing protein [FCB group bacterium]|jgi:uncharacterized protein YebE (UPF0316 family)|nr:DUF5698 domain-containing protein [FCB group bacterium]
MNLHAELFFLFFARTADMCLGTLRNILAVRGYRFPAAAVAFVEVIIYLLALGLMLGDTWNPVRMVVFSAGYAFGVFLGTVVDDRLALGQRLMQVVLNASDAPLVKELRAEWPVTTWQAEGHEGGKLILHVLVPRRASARLAARIRKSAPTAFIVQLEPRGFAGGLLPPLLLRKVPDPILPSVPIAP